MAEVDVLSEVLRVVRLSGALHFRAEFSQPWAILSSPPEILAARFKPGAEVITPFHIATEGRCYVSWGTSPAILLEVGDVVIFPRGTQHVLASDPGLQPTPIREIYRPVEGQVAVLQFGGGGAPCRFVCGFLHSDQKFNPLLDAMPTMLCVRVRGPSLIIEAHTDAAPYAEPVTLDENPGWWQTAIRHLAEESTRPGPGNRAVIARLSELLFMEILRWQLRYVGRGHGGWLAGLADPQVGRALTLLHGEPARDWTVDDLARQSGVSRAALARRFAELVGDSPMQYLTGWRMHLARHMLRESGLNIAELAARVGYESEAAFSRAFRRVMGVPPAAWREAEAARTAPARA